MFYKVLLFTTQQSISCQPFHGVPVTKQQAVCPLPGAGWHLLRWGWLCARFRGWVSAPGSLCICHYDSGVSQAPFSAPLCSSASVFWIRAWDNEISKHPLSVQLPSGDSPCLAECAVWLSSNVKLVLVMLRSLLTEGLQGATFQLLLMRTMKVPSAL